MTTQREQDVYTIARQYDRAIWEGINGLLAMQAEWTALDYLATLDPGAGANEGLVAQDLSDVIFTTANALKALLEEGHATNMAKLL